jgi:hypothetical protein
LLLVSLGAGNAGFRTEEAFAGGSGYAFPSSAVKLLSQCRA